MNLMMKNSTIPAAFLFLAMAMAAGCAGGMKTDDSAKTVLGSLETAQRQIELIREEAEAAAGATGGLEEIRVPASEAWLDRPLAAKYLELCAHDAIRALVRNRPVRFEISPAEQSAIPMVRLDPSARTIRDHLESVAKQANWSWYLDGGVVMVRDIETRRFSLSIQPGSYTAGLGLRNLNASGGSIADNNVELQLDPYVGEFVTQVRSVLGIAEGSAAAQALPDPRVEFPDNGYIDAVGVGGASGPVCTHRPPFDSGEHDPRTAVEVSPSAHLLTVTARPNAMREVEALVEEFDSTVSRIVRIQLSLIEVDFRDGEKRDLALNLIRRSSEFPINLLLGSSTASVLPGSDGAASIFGGTVVNEGGAAIGGGYAEPGRRATGSTAVAQWLDTLGDATIAYDDTVEVLNNRVASVDLTRTRQYISEITREVVVGSDQLSTEVEFRDLRTGMVVHLQPTARTDGRITLTLGVSRSALVGTNTYSFGSIAGETHVTDDFNRLLSISLKDGETRLLASLSESETRGESARIPILGRFGIGTSRNRNSRGREMVMMITATVIDD